MGNKIEFLDLKKQYKSIKREIDAAINRTLNSCDFVGGKEVEEIEKKIAELCGVKYAIGVNSGTDALFLSLKALGIGAGNEVITTPFTFIATAEIIANLGARPVFADIESDTFNISPELVEGLITSRTKAIIPVHLFGQMAEMKYLMDIAEKYNLFVVEDAAQAMGAQYKSQILNLNDQSNSKYQNPNFKTKWRMAGTIGDLGCFSFFPSKNLGAYGDAGMVVTNNKELAEKIRLLRNHGSDPKEKYKNLLLGTNSRLDSIQAAILKVKIKYLKKWNKERAERAGYYNKELEKIKEITTPAVFPQRTHTFYSYVIRASGRKRDGLAEYLDKKGIPTMVYYPLPLHLQPAFKYLGYKKGDFPESEKAAKEVLSLPVYPEITRKEQDFIIKSIKEFYGKKG